MQSSNSSTKRYTQFLTASAPLPVLSDLDVRRKLMKAPCVLLTLLVLISGCSHWEGGGTLSGLATVSALAVAIPLIPVAEASGSERRTLKAEGIAQWVARESTWRVTNKSFFGRIIRKWTSNIERRRDSAVSDPRICTKGHEYEIFWQNNFWQNNQVTKCCMTRLRSYLFFSSASIRAICG